MIQLVKHYRLEACWFLLLVAFMLLSPRRISSQRVPWDCQPTYEDGSCDAIGMTCPCE